MQSDLGLHSPHVFAWCRPYYRIQRYLTCSRLLTVMLFYLSSDSSLFRALKLRTLCSVIPNFLLSIVLSNSISCSHDIHIWACWVCCGYLFLALLIRSKAILYCPFNEINVHITYLKPIFVLSVGNNYSVFRENRCSLTVNFQFFYHCDLES